MSLWVKICGMTGAEAVAACLEARVDAIGFVFAQSVRQVTAAQAAMLAAPARGRVLCVAVTRHPSQQALDEVLEVFQPDVLQTDAEDYAGLRLPLHLQALPVYRTRTDAEATAVLPARLLFEGPASGSGRTGDWDGARVLAARTELVLAGGLNTGNVAHAVQQVHPFGIDVSSGVEQRPGLKNPAEIARFVAAARSAMISPEEN